MDPDDVVRKYPGLKRFGQDLESEATKKPRRSKEQLKDMMEVVPEVVHVDPITVKYPIADWSIYTNKFGKAWKSQGPMVNL